MKNLLAAEEEDCNSSKTCKCCKCSKAWGCWCNWLFWLLWLFWLFWLFWGDWLACFDDVDVDVLPCLSLAICWSDCNLKRVLIDV